MFLTLLLLLVLVPTSLRAGAEPVFLDGDFADWSAVAPVAQDALGDGGASGIDFDRMWLANDGASFFVRVEIGTELVMQENNDITLYVDTDDDPGTGTSVAGLGADLVWVFGARGGSYQGSPIFWDAIGIVNAPSFSGDDFEIALRRDATPSGNALFPSGTIRVAMRDDGSGGDWIPSASSHVTYTFDDSDPLDPQLTDLAKSDPSHLRIMTHNTRQDGLWSNPGEHERLVQAIVPDVIAYQEIYDHAGSETRTWVENALGGTWQVDQDFELHLVSRHPILQAWDTGEGRARASLIDLPSPFDQELLVINLHLSCCSSGDSDRQDQIDDVMSFVRDALSPGGAVTLAADTPIVILGDTNMYGSAQQVTTLLTGDIANNGAYGPDFTPDWDGSELDAVVSRHPSVRHSFTWYNEGSSFGPSHIDRITVTGSVVNVEKSYVLHTPWLPPATLAAYGLNASDSQDASDHVPHVLDLSAGGTGTTVGACDVVRSSVWMAARPTPFSPRTQLRFHVPRSGRVRIDVFDAAGRRVEGVLDAHRSAGEHAVEWTPPRGAAAGAYFARIETRDGSETTKLILIR